MRKIEINSFFATKEAADNPDKLIDPGEAAAAGISFAAGPMAQKVLPIATRIVASQFAPSPKLWSGSTMKGSSIEAMGLMDTSPGANVKLLNAIQEEKPLLNLFKANLIPKVGPGQIALATPEVLQIHKIQPLVDSMINRYKLPEKGVTVEFTRGPLSRITGPSYNPKTKNVKLPFINESIALHEVGHAAHMTQPAARELASARRIISKGIGFAVPMAYIAGNEIKKMFPGTIDDKVIDFIQGHAPAIVASSYLAAQVYPEVQATTRAVEHVYRMKGAAAARQALKKMLPSLAGYVLPAIPAIVGLSLAKKYFYDAEKKLKKEAGIVSNVTGLASQLAGIGVDAGYIASHVSSQASNLFKQPAMDIAKTMFDAGIKTVKSPHFVEGAITAGLPAAAAAYVYHNTAHGKVFREKSRQLKSKRGPIAKSMADINRVEESANHDSTTFPAIVGITAALSGGFLAKMWGDIMNIL